MEIANILAFLMFYLTVPGLLLLTFCLLYGMFILVVWFINWVEDQFRF